MPRTTRLSNTGPALVVAVLSLCLPLPVLAATLPAAAQPGVSNGASNVADAAAGVAGVADSDADARLLVTYEPQVSDAAQPAVTAELFTEAADASGPLAPGDGVALVTDAPASNLAVLDVPADALEEVAAELSDDPRVKYVELDAPITLEQAPSAPELAGAGGWGHAGAQPAAGLPASPYGTDASGAWAEGYTGLTGQRSYVGVIDTRIDLAHPDLAGRLWTNPIETADGIDNDGNGYVDDVRGWNVGEDTADIQTLPGGSAHATHIAGIIGGDGDNGIGVAGVSWNVGIIPVSMYNADGNGFVSAAVQSIDYLVDLKRRAKINLVAINASWGSGLFSYALQDALRRAGDAGIVVVAAAGNYNRDTDTTPFYPASNSCSTWWRQWDCVVAVGAHDKAGRRVDTSFTYWGSNYGATSVDLTAPGLAIRSTAPGGGYRTGDGTSYATPFVTGALALCANLAPGMPPDVMTERLYATTVPTASALNTTVTGGRLDVSAFAEGCAAWARGDQTYGQLDVVRQSGLGTVSISGWARGTDTTTSVPVPVTVDGVPLAELRADAARNDAGSSLTGYRSPSGFASTFPLTQGVREVCAVFDTQSDCRSIHVLTAADPIGVLESIRLDASGDWRMDGWVIDPDASANTTVDVTVDGAFLFSLSAELPSASMTESHPGWGPDRGFAALFDTPKPGPQQVCTIARNRGVGRDKSLGCKTLFGFSSRNPVGTIDALTRTGPRTARLSGWALDPDSDTPTRVDVSVNGRIVSQQPAAISRPDVARAHPGYGPARGFSVDATLSPGNNTICVVAVNQVRGTSNTVLGCRLVTVASGNPRGNLEQVRRTGSGTAQVAGWALDPDTAAAIPVHVYVNGRSIASPTASVNRPDVARTFPGWGAQHGFDVTIRPGRGTHRVCVYAINQGLGSSNPLLGCRDVVL